MFREKIRQLLRNRKKYSIYYKCELVIHRVLGETYFHKIEGYLKRWINGIKYSSNKLAFVPKYERQKPPNTLSLGVNVAGYITTESGTAEGVRGTIRSLKSVGIPHALNNFTSNNSRKGDLTYAAECIEENPYSINLIQMNADQIYPFYLAKGNSYLKGKYNIGFWAWELETFPKEWLNAFDYFHEIWTYSSFSQAALSRVSPIPVLRIFPSFEVKQTHLVSREELGLPVDKYIFLFVFDFFSFFERKNPLGLIRAFKKAFSQNDNTILIIKCMNAEKDLMNFEKLKLESQDFPIRIMNQYLSREQLHGLFENCDAYVSLHRSEGFGLTLAEAMHFGRPVIATDYSANTDFMTTNNSFPVKYSLSEIQKNEGPYTKGNLWAYPDIDDAAHWMRYVYENRSDANEIGKKAAQDVRALFSPKRVGGEIMKRLTEIIESTRK